MALRISKGPVRATDHPEDQPREQWPRLTEARRSFLEIKLPYVCRKLLRFVDEADQIFVVRNQLASAIRSTARSRLQSERVKRDAVTNVTHLPI